jgi:hypothetical protein
MAHQYDAGLEQLRKALQQIGLKLILSVRYAQKQGLLSEPIEFHRQRG